MGFANLYKINMVKTKILQKIHWRKWMIEVNNHLNSSDHFYKHLSPNKWSTFKSMVTLIFIVDLAYHPFKDNQMSTRNSLGLVVKSKLCPSNGSIALGQLKPIYKKGP